ncbi:RHS repeat-associated core domain-containing protein [Streptomyces pseudogriseolus]
MPSLPGGQPAHGAAAPRLCRRRGQATHTSAAPPACRAPRPTDAAPRPTRYAGAYADPTGLYKMGHRYYAPLGRFTQPDTSGQETNPYLYASGDPINNIDPPWPIRSRGHAGCRRCEHRRHRGRHAGSRTCGRRSRWWLRRRCCR